MEGLKQAVRDDPVGSAIAALLAVFVTLLGAQMAMRYAPPPIIHVAWPIHLPDMWGPRPTPVPLPPHEWEQKADPDDVFHGETVEISYWGKPDATYAKSATRKAERFRGLVVHYTEDRPALAFVEYQHNGDDDRGGSFGYHFYVDRWGRVFQGAPLSKRTNHIKPPMHKARRHGVATHLGSNNSIGVSMVGGCWRNPAKLTPITKSCDGEKLTQAQQDAGERLIRALMLHYHLEPSDVFGHGDLQHDRSEFEGSTLTRLIRSGWQTAGMR